MLLDQLATDMKNAMKSAQPLKVSVLRMVLSDCKYARVEKMRDLEDLEVMQVIRRGIKSREDSESQYRAAGRADLAEKEAAESAILREYLPEPLSSEELEAIVTEAIRDTGAVTVKDTGKVMKAVMAAHGARVDGKQIQKILVGRLSPN
jgi:uncharacterized protein